MGPITLEFEPELGFVRYVRLGDIEILRGIYVAVRDQTWGTVLPRVSNVKETRNAADFQVTFDVACVEKDIDYLWKGQLTGSAEGNLRFSMDGEARSTFHKNRIGFCVLHPLRECAGRPCLIETSTGKREARFPEDIAPSQPFKDLKAITHRVAPGIQAEVRFEGDIFETEDHRNWTDANFKTYCTPLERPFPVRIEKGTKITQAIALRLIRSPGTALPPKSTSSDIVTLVPAGPSRHLPHIGFGFVPFSPDHLDKLRALKPAHIRVDLPLNAPAWQDTLKQSLGAAQQLNAKLECALFVDDEADTQLRTAAKELPAAAIARVLVFHVKETSTNAKWILLARTHFGNQVRISAGTNNYFTELNRGRPATNRMSAVCYSINPQVHASDDTSVVENLEGQGPTVRSARKLFSGKEVIVTPVTLKPRFNPMGPSDPAARIDPRQKTPFGAAWTLGSLKYLSEAGADSVTYYELVGPAGLLDDSGVFPVYSVFTRLVEFAGGDVIPIQSSAPLRVIAMQVRARSKQQIFVANLTGQQQSVLLPGAHTPRALQPYELAIA